MNKGKNNFTKPGVTDESIHKLWVAYDENSTEGKFFIKKTGKAKFIYFGYNNKPNHGKASLEKIVKSKFPRIKVAILYTNRVEAQRWENPAFSTKNQ